MNLERAMALINDYSLGEFEHEADFDNLEEVGLAYTTLSDEDYDVQVSCDLVNFRVWAYDPYSDIVYYEHKYDSLEDMINSELEYLDFSEMLPAGDDVLRAHLTINYTTDGDVWNFTATDNNGSEIKRGWTKAVDIDMYKCVSVEDYLFNYCIV